MSVGVKDVAAGRRGVPGHRLQRAQPSRPGQPAHPGPGGAGHGRARLRPQRVGPAAAGRAVSRTLAYVVLDAGNPFFTDVARGVEDAADAARPLAVHVQQRQPRGPRARRYLEPPRGAAGAGVLLTPVDPESPLARRRSPGAAPRSSSSTAPAPDDHLLLGRRRRRARRPAGRRAPARPRPQRIAFIGGPATIGQVRDRLRGRPAALAPTPGCRRGHLVAVDDRRADASPRAARPASGWPASRVDGAPPRRSAPTTCWRSACSSSA